MSSKKLAGCIVATLATCLWLNTTAWAVDCNTNTIPDATEIAGNPALDCNTNGKLDVCDIAAGTGVTDCNTDTTPDVCQLVGRDCNSDGTIDVCQFTGIFNSFPARNGFLDISTNGAAANPNSPTDDSSTNLSIPFSNLYNASTNGWVTSNGVVYFNATAINTFTNTALPTATYGLGKALYVFWDDLIGTTTAPASQIYWQTLGSAPNRTFVVLWKDMGNRLTGAGDRGTIELQIFENNAFGVFAQYIYQDVGFNNAATDNGLSATIGYQLSSTSAVQWSFNTASITSGTVLTLIAGPGTDCDTNGTLDLCELSGRDCNTDGTIDICQLTGRDCNTDSIIDLCQLVDCNTNNTLDVCDAATNRVSPRQSQTNATAMAIPDAQSSLGLGAFSPINVLGFGLVADANVQLSIQHTLPANMRLYVIHNAVTATLYAGTSAAAGQNFTGTVFDDSAATSITVSTNTPPFSNTFQASQSATALATFNSQQKHGLWYLRAADATSNNTGTLLTWSLFLQTRIADDCNTNGRPDECDILSFGFADANADGILDICQDCNSNGVPDPIDAGSDCNTNAVPDVCEPDCNTNGLADPCDLAASNSASFAGTGLPAVIPDNDTNTGVSNTIAVGSGGALSDVNVQLSIQHTAAGDLDILMINGGLTVTLSDDNGGTLDHFTNTVFDDQAFAAITVATLAPYSATFRPETALSAFNGRNQAGNWTLRVFDDTATNTGTLLSWSLFTQTRVNLDCNTNGTPDSCDQLGGLADCNTNGTLDRCELVDCNTNGTLDLCDVVLGGAPDCNTNLRPDVCDLLGPKLTTWPATDVPKTINDNVTVLSTTTVALSETVVDVDVKLSIQHTWDSDVDILLVHGASGTLSDDNGGSADNYVNTLFDDSAALSVVGQAAPFTNTYRPETALSLFNGSNSSGTWDLSIGDDATGDTGTLLSWTLFLTTLHSNDCNTNGTPDACDLDANHNGTPDICEDCNTNFIPDSIEPGFADCNTNGSADFCDLGINLMPDCNTNATPDVCELSGGRDCNTNNTPDICDTVGGAGDCNTDRTPDVCQLAGGNDCNTNGTVDICDVDLGGARDCNSDNTPDVCQLSLLDCNTNGRLDPCDAFGSTSLDCQTNGTPDECELAGSGTVTYNSTDVPKSPPDATPAGVTSILTITGSANITDVNVQLTHTHTWCSDLILTISHLSGTSTLSNHRGGSGRQFTGTVFDDQSLTPISAATGNFTDTYIPDSPLAVFNAMDRAGTWTLFTADTVSGDVGDLTAWSAVITFASPGDCNTNGTPDACDLDANHNGTPDICEDCNTNGIPDSSEPGYADCDTNATADFCELSGHDCNTNNTPDGCELSGGRDCNTNNTPDVCDIAGGAADCNTDSTPDICQFGDCNTNLVLDLCDIAGPTSNDCNTNALPDECELGSGLPAISQPPDAVNGLFSDPTCSQCGSGAQSVADNFVLSSSTAITAVGVSGGYFPGNGAYASDGFTVIFHSNAGGLPGPAINTQVGVPSSRVDTGVILFGVHRYAYVLNIAPVVLAPGTYFMEVFNTGAGTDTWFWETGTLAPQGVLNDAFATAVPGVTWLVGSPVADNSFTLYAGLPDCDTNGTIDVCDLDANTNGTPDACEDCNTNGITDPLEPAYRDCNTNFTADFCEIAAGVPDCNTDGTIDRCQYGDCDTNNTLDICDVRINGAADCNSNVIPDVCEFVDCNTNGTNDVCDIPPSLDCNTNSVPDECELDAAVDLTSPDMVPGGTQTFTISPAHLATSPVLLTFGCIGDIDGAVGSGNEEDFAVDVNGTAVGLAYDDNAPYAQCGTVNQVDTITIPAATWNAALTGGMAAIHMVANANVNPTLCGTGVTATNYLRVRVQYLSGGDCNSNGIPDACDLDANHNGTADDCEDCNTNGIPDPSEPGYADCNSNMQADFCDISLGVDTDCNTDGIPDHCQFGDCNTNGRLDVCDIALGEADCNADHTPDVCQFVDCNTNGTNDVCDIPPSLDCNTNSVPDVCELSGTITVTDNPGLIILDNSSFDTDINVASGPVVADVNVGLTILHTYTNDVDITLIHNAVTVTLSDDNGNFGTNEDFLGTVFDDSAAVSITDTTQLPPYTGTYQPETPLASYNTMSSSGAWTLRVADDVGGDTGTLVTWTLEIAGGPGSGDCNTNGVPDACDLDANTNGTPDACEAAVCPTCTGDINGDGNVDGQDIAGWVRCSFGVPLPADNCACTAGMTQAQFITKLLTDPNPACP